VEIDEGQDDDDQEIDDGDLDDGADGATEEDLGAEVDVEPPPPGTGAYYKRMKDGKPVFYSRKHRRPLKTPPHQLASRRVKTLIAAAKRVASDFAAIGFPVRFAATVLQPAPPPRGAGAGAPRDGPSGGGASGAGGGSGSRTTSARRQGAQPLLRARILLTGPLAASPRGEELMTLLTNGVLAEEEAITSRRKMKRVRENDEVPKLGVQCGH
jgi:hypothetical protein